MPRAGTLRPGPTWDEILQNADGTDPLIELVASNTGLAIASGSEVDSNGDPLMATTYTGFTDVPQILGAWRGTMPRSKLS